ncbi:MAG TPA: hypothetical protein VFN05_14395 [Actinomycetes bacterium]|nr:hypothetical protein [Actinomycetes bacterium]
MQLTVSHRLRLALGRALHESVLLVLVVTGIVHVVRRNLLDVTLFFGMAGLILVERTRPPGPRPRDLQWPGPAVVLGGCILFGVAMLPLAQGSWPMRILVAVPGLLALLVVLRAGPTPALSPQADPPGRRWWLWVLVGVTAGLFELANFVSQGGSPDANPDHPTVTAVVDPLFTHTVFRAGFAMLWAAAGAWLVHAATTSTVEADR